MPTLNVRETLDLLRILAQRGVARKFGDLRDEVEELGGRLAQAAQAPLGTNRNLVEMLPEFQQSAADALRLSEQAEAGLGQLAGVFSQLGLESESVLRSEREEIPPKLYIDVETGIVVEGKIAGRLPQGRMLTAVAVLAEAKSPVPQSELSQAVFEKDGKAPWLRRRISILNEGAEKLELPNVIVSPNRAGYVLGPDYEVIGRTRTFYPELAPAHAEPLPMAPEPAAVREKKRRPDLAETLGAQQFFYGATVTERTGVGQTALDLMGELGVLKEGVHYVRRGERNIRVYTPDAVALAEELAKFAKTKGQGRFTERLVRDAFGFPSEERQKNPYGEDGPRVFTDQTEFLLLNTLQTCAPALQRRYGIDILSGQGNKLRERIAQLKGIVEIPVGEQTTVRKSAAATAFTLTQNRRPFNYLQREHPGLLIVGKILEMLKAEAPEMLNEFPRAVFEPPESVARVGGDSRVNGSTLVGPMGDRRR